MYTSPKSQVDPRVHPVEIVDLMSRIHVEGNEIRVSEMSKDFNESSCEIRG